MCIVLRYSRLFESVNSCWSDSQHYLSTHRVKSNTMIAAILQIPHMWTEGREGERAFQGYNGQYSITMVLTHICNRPLSCYQIFHVRQCPYVVDNNITLTLPDKSHLLVFKLLFRVLFPRKLANLMPKRSLESSDYGLFLTKAEDWSWHLSIPEFSVKNQHQ